MLTRICWIAVTTAGVVLAAIGLVVAPFAVLTAGLVAVLVGALAAMHVYGTRKQDVGIDGKRGSHIGAVRVGLALTLATMAASMVAVGLTFLLGVGAVVVIAVLLAVVGIAGWRRRRAGPRQRRAGASVDPAGRVGSAGHRTTVSGVAAQLLAAARPAARA
jgi:4-hydroxybenzoate polyprenyltransferase